MLLLAERSAEAAKITSRKENLGSDRSWKMSTSMRDITITLTALNLSPDL